MLVQMVVWAQTGREQLIGTGGGGQDGENQGPSGVLTNQKLKPEVYV